MSVFGDIYNVAKRPANALYNTGKDAAHGRVGATISDMADVPTFGAWSLGERKLENGIKAIPGALGDLSDAVTGKSAFDAVANANEKAGNDLRTIGNVQAGNIQAGNTIAEGQLEGRGGAAYDQAYGEGGTLSSPSISQQRYDEVRNGSDPIAAYQRGEGVRTLGDQFAAAGGLRSGAFARALSNMDARVQSDAATRADQLANQASQQQTQRAEYSIPNAFNLGSKEADLTSSAFRDAGEAQAKGGIAGVDSDLAKANVGLDSYKNKLGLLSKAVGFASGLIKPPSL